MTTDTDTPTAPALTLADIQQTALRLSQSRDALTGYFNDLQRELNQVQTSFMPAIKRVVREISKRHAELADQIRANPDLFVRPRTHVMAGLKFGLQKKVGTLSWEDDDKLVERILKLASDDVISGDQADMLLKVTTKPVAKALEQLDGKVLKRLGVTLGADTDEPLIKSVDSEVEKAVNAVIKDATKDVTKDSGAEVTA